MSDRVLAHLGEAAAALARLSADRQAWAAIESAAGRIVGSLKAGGKVLTVGNGGSMCDAMHFAEELLGRYRGDRPAMAAIACSDPSFITCAANDFGYDETFRRFVQGLGHAGDILVAFSTSGRSQSVVLAAEAAKANGLTVVALTGRPNSKLAERADIEICCPAGDTADRVQELHLKVVHILIDLIEEGMGYR